MSRTSFPLFAAADVPGDWLFIELGAAVLGLAILTRLAYRLGFSAIPFYLLGGLAFGNGGLLPLHFTEEFVHVGAEIGVILLLFMLGLEYTGEQLRDNLRSGFAAGAADLLLNFPPGFLAGLLLGWGPLAALLLGGVTYISSSGIAARVLEELRRLGNPETPTILSILVLEDLAMAVYLPLVAVLLIGQAFIAGLIAVAAALATVGLVLLAALRYGTAISQVLTHKADEAVLLSTFGLVLLVAGVAQRLQVSAAVGAFLVGVALSGPLVRQTHRLFGPLRDLFAALFFLFFGLQIDPRTLPPVLGPALALAIITGLTKLLTGWWAVGRAGGDRAGRLRTGAALLARGEFSIVIAGLGVRAGLNHEMGPLTAAYVLILAVTGPLVARLIKDRPSLDRPKLIEEQYPVEIRPYQEGDESGVIALWGTVLAYTAPHNDPASVIRHKLALQRELFLVGLVDGALVGTVMGGYDGHRGWIYSLAVSPEVRRRGIGTALMKEIEAQLAARGCPKVNLQVLASNAATVEFYKKLGYSVEERVSMGKLLASPCSR
jgi:CPA2 family monovalent cation:H+ antiporter-2